RAPWWRVRGRWESADTWAGRYRWIISRGLGDAKEIYEDFLRISPTTERNTRSTRCGKVLPQRTTFHFAAIIRRAGVTAVAVTTAFFGSPPSSSARMATS